MWSVSSFFGLAIQGNRGPRKGVGHGGFVENRTRFFFFFFQRFEKPEKAQLFPEKKTGKNLAENVESTQRVGDLVMS